MELRKIVTKNSNILAWNIVEYKGIQWKSIQKTPQKGVFFGMAQRTGLCALQYIVL